jgi:serine/threonine protein kinase
VTGGARLGDYELEAVVGEGALGVVHQARSADGRIVALKILKPVLGEDEEFRSRLAREVRAAQEVTHRHLVAVLDHGETPDGPFVVFEYLGGGSLADRLEAGPLDLGAMVRLIADVAAGLNALHVNGIVHRDVKPSNIMLRNDDSAALTDFGLAKSSAHSVLTHPGQVVGTLDYLAPELVRGEEATSRSDIYALGCVAFECLAGRPPFSDRSLFGVGTAHLEDDPPDPPAPAEVAWALLRALEKDPADRPPTPTAYAHLLRAAARRA